MGKQAMGNKKAHRRLLAGILVSALAAPATADAGGVTVYKQDDKYVELGGRIQVQYHREDPDQGETTDELFFRRLRPYIEGSLHKDWMGKFQWEMGQASGDNEIAVKDAYMRYTGFKDLTATLGNALFPFSREQLTSSLCLELVERTFVGDHNYGTPNRNLGLHLTGGLLSKKLTWAASFAAADIDPDANKLDLDSPVTSDEDFNQGWIYGGRVDFHPFGYLKFCQGDFDRKDLKAAIGVAAFGWNNDNDNNTRTNAQGLADDNPATIEIDSTTQPDVDSVAGFEVSGALRFAGLSVDVEYNLFNAETVDPMFTGGIYKNGETYLSNFAVEGGYMVVPAKLELAGAWQAQDADNYAAQWTRASVGVNYYIKREDIKLQLTYRMGQNLNGIKGQDENELFVQAQFAF
ncbi:MAG: porin [Deltaproteobacteria bacterium]